MKKVGLVTYYGDNYGGCLQAYALQQMIRRHDVDCEIIEYNILTNSVISKFRRRLGYLIHPIKRFREHRIMRQSRPFQAMRHRKFEEFRKNYLKIAVNGNKSGQDFYVNPPQYDAYWCGSDQIWNPCLTNSVNPVYFLDFVPEGKARIAYAPSVAVSEVPAAFQAEMAGYLEKFTLISVREIQSVETIGKFSNVKVTPVLDPTLMLTAEDWKALLPANRTHSEPYIFCYLFGDMPYIRRVKEHIREVTGYKLVSFPYNTREMVSDDILVYDAGPLDFVEAIRNAAFVITDSFHATAFCCNFNVPFYSLLRVDPKDPHSMHSRLFSLLNILGCPERIVTPGQPEIDDKLMDCDFTRVNAKLREWRERSSQYIEKAMELSCL